MWKVKPNPLLLSSRSIKQVYPCLLTCHTQAKEGFELVIVCFTVKEIFHQAMKLPPFFILLELPMKNKSLLHCPIVACVKLCATHHLCKEDFTFEQLKCQN